MAAFLPVTSTGYIDCCGEGVAIKGCLEAIQPGRRPKGVNNLIDFPVSGKQVLSLLGEIETGLSPCAAWPHLSPRLMCSSAVKSIF